jgi:hypothetical protein
MHWRASRRRFAQKRALLRKGAHACTVRKSQGGKRLATFLAVVGAFSHTFAILLRREIESARFSRS